jgi:uncharacterized membrane-anchored protein YhcB (DUF1043 family)
MTPEELEIYLAKRFAHEREATIEAVTKEVKELLDEQLREVDQGFAKLQSLIDQLKNLIEKQARLDHVARGEPVDSAKIN